MCLHINPLYNISKIYLNYRWLYVYMRLYMQDRKYQKKKTTVEKFIKKSGRIDHSVILNNVDIDYDTLMRILSELRNEGRIS